MREPGGPHERNPCVASPLLRHQGALLRRRPPPELKLVMATQDLSEGHRAPAVDRSQRAARGGSIGLVLLVAVVLVGAAVGLLLVGRGNAEPYILALLAVLAMVGVFSLFALAAGILRVPARTPRARCSRRWSTRPSTASWSPTARPRALRQRRLSRPGRRSRRQRRAAGRARVHRRSRRVGGDLPPAQGGARRPPRCRRRCGSPASRAGRRAGCGCACGRSARHGASSQLTLWTVADVTRERERQENVFQELQHAIDYLDHAPAGFFSVDGNGDVGYLNATLADWLDHDLAQVGSGGLKLADIVAGDGAALLTTLRARAGRGEDRGARPRPQDPRRHARCRCGCFTRSRSAPTARPAPRARWCSTARATRRPIRSAPPKCASCASSTHADGDRDRRQGGQDRRAPMRCSPGMFHGAPSDGEGEGRSILAVVAERDRAALEAAIAKAADGQGDIAPVDAALERRAASARRASTCLPVEDEERDGEAAIVYALETTEQRDAGEPGRPGAEDGTRSASSPAASRTTSTTCCPPS